MNREVVMCGAVVLGSLTFAAPQDAQDLNPVTFHAAPKHAPVVLVEAGEPRAEIVYSKQEMPRGAYRAVNDLQRYIERTTDARLPIVGTATDGATTIAFVSDRALPQEGFAMVTEAGGITISGNGEGLTHGIYEFLERYVGVRWYWPDYRNETAADCGTSVLWLDNLVIPPVHLSDAPFFLKRHRYPSGGRNIGKADMRSHDARLRCGNTWPVSLMVHAPHDWATPYRESRPEIFELRGDGERNYRMLCYGHPRTLETYVHEIELQLAGEVEIDNKRRIVRDGAVSVSPADMGVACRCEHCKTLWAPDAGHYGTASRVLGTFVAKLGVAIKDRWPELTVIYLPYKNYTYAPEGVEFPDNVEVQICGMPGLALYKDTEIRASEQRNIDAWGKLTGRPIQNWHYSCWPANRTDAAYLFPYTIQQHYRDNRDKTVGSFINGVKDHWPRQHLSLYVWLKVLWNPEVNVDAIIDTYCTRMYGPAAGTMRELVQRLIDGWEQSDWDPHVLSPLTVYEQSYPRGGVEEIEVLFKKALAEASHDELALRRLRYYEPALRAFFTESKQLAEGAGGRPIKVYQVTEDPVIDGKLDDKQWQGIDPVTFTAAGATKGEPVRQQTEFRAVWSHKGVTFAWRAVEAEIDMLKADIQADSRDASLIWWNDCFEAFVDATGKRAGYVQFIVNPRGALYDSVGRGDTGWNAVGAKSAGYIGKDFWSAELFIPYDAFADVALPGTGVEWHGNFMRHRVTDRKNREYTAFNVSSGKFPSHNQNAFVPLRFIER